MTTEEFIVEDSGQREHFTSGAVRDTQEGKTRYDLISPYALRRIGDHMTKGALKYGERNWEKGMPRSRFIASALRHLYKWIMGSREEDHLAAVCFNIMAIMHFEEQED